MLRVSPLAILICALLITAAAQSAVAQSRSTNEADSDAAPTVEVEKKAEERIRAALAKKVTLDFIETSLGDALASITDDSAIPIVMDRAALEFAHIDLDVPITISISGVTLRSALRWMLRDLDLTTTVRDETLLVTTPDQAEEHIIVSVYPVRDLIEYRHLDGVKEDDPDSLIYLIEGFVAPDTWESGSMNRDYRGLIVIGQTFEVHEQIRALLAAIRKVPIVEQMSAEERARIDTTPVPAAVHDHANIKRALQQQASIDYVDTPLDDVLHDLSDKHKIPILIDRRALEFAEVETDTPITTNLSGVTLKSALRHVLRNLDLTYVLVSEVLLITTPDESSQSPTIVVYPIADILEYDDENHADFDSIIDAIVNNVEPMTWNALGGAGSLHEIPQRGAILCSQTQYVHDQIESLLSKIREHREQLTSPERPDPDEIILKVYQLYPTGGRDGDKEPPEVDAKEVVAIVVELTGSELWKTDGAYIKAMSDRLILRQRRAVHKQVHSLLSNLGLRGGGGFGQPLGRIFSGAESNGDSQDDLDDLFSE